MKCNFLHKNQNTNEKKENQHEENKVILYLGADRFKFLRYITIQYSPWINHLSLRNNDHIIKNTNNN